MAPRFTKLDSIVSEIKDHAKQFAKNAGDRPVVAAPQGPAEKPLRVKQVAPPGTELVAGHPALKKKV